MKNKITMFDNKKLNSYQNILYDNDLAIEQSEYDANNFDDEPDFNDWSIEDYQILTNWKTVQHNGWSLPATIEPHYWCGLWNTKGCLHVEDHYYEHREEVYVRRYQRSCFRPVCEICYKKWIGRQANVSTRKIERYSKREKMSPVHLVLSVSHWDYDLDFTKMKKKVRKILKEIKIRGGSIIFHPFRFNKKIRCWYYSPHFHVVGFGYIPEGAITNTYSQNGWFVKYLGVRKSVFATFYYLLSHCGIKKRIHTVSWFGDLSYSKLKKEIMPDHNVCPLCKRKLVEIYYNGWDPPVPPDSFFEGFVNSEGWYTVKTEKDFENKKARTFEYDSRSNVNEILKGLAEAR
jgi:hypothetical protein